jgi:RNA-directed DNA polymerase
LGKLSTPTSVRKLQRALYAKAKSEAGYRFYALYDKMYRQDILAHAYAQYRSNKGAPGVDGEDFVCMTAAMLVLEPVFKADLPPEQYAYRPGRNAQQAANEVEERLHRGQTDVVDADLADYR